MKLHRMIVPIVAATALVGCTASLEPAGAPSKAQAAQLAAYAATAKYPVESNTAEMRVAALLKGNNIRMINFTDQPIRNANIWVNGMFVHEVDVIPPQASVTLQRSEFYDKTGHSLAEVSSAATRVTIQVGDKLNTTLGAINE